VTCVENCRLLYLPASSFYRIFSIIELEKMKEFTKVIDNEKLKERIVKNWN